MDDEAPLRHRALTRQAWGTFVAGALVAGGLLLLPSGMLGQRLYISTPVLAAGSACVVVLIVLGARALGRARRVVGGGKPEPGAGIGSPR